MKKDKIDNVINYDSIDDPKVIEELDRLFSADELEILIDYLSES